MKNLREDPASAGIVSKLSGQIDALRNPIGRLPVDR
jgi:hypothetical protein